MALNALLILSTTTLRRPKQIQSSLAATLKHSQRFSGILYVHIWRSRKPKVNKINPSLWGSITELSKAIMSVYSHASSHCPNIDVRFIVKNPRMVQKLETRRLIDLVFVDNGLRGVEEEVEDYVRTSVINKSENYKLQILSEFQEEEEEEPTLGCGTENEDKSYNIVILGGTFDRLHNGHKILLTESVLRCQKELIVGVTDENMTKSKLLCELIEPLQVRIDKVQEFLEDISPPLRFRPVPISDPFGPTITEKDVELIVVSQETIRGADKINEIRKQKDFLPLFVHVIELYSEPNKESDHEEDKISSSSKRLRLLGERLRPPLQQPSLPYIIGLTGGIASGKSTICSYLESFEVAIISSDQLAHEAYKLGTECFKQVVATFGDDILDENKQTINRRCLGSKVFGKPIELKKLTDIVWPEVKRLSQEKIAQLAANGQNVIVLDAPVLLEAGSDKFCHEVWVTFIPKEEAIRRIEERDKLTREAAENRINSQMCNREKLNKGTFAFCSLWEKEFTRIQVDKAFAQIQSVILKLRDKE